MTNVNLYARATEHIPEIISQIERLVDLGFAYETETGVYFDESRFEDFGKLSHQTLEEVERHRIEPDPTKRNSGDFSLWKKREDGAEVTWDSPWGRGRPGWHIEDTAITETYFGPQYDIHGGAMDLIFPHHEAEIAQMEATSGKKPLVRCWMHTGFLNVKGEKMSKSLGNFMTIREMLERCDADAFRLFVLLAHYRSPIDFSEEVLEQSRKSLERIRHLIRIIEEQLEMPGEIVESEEVDPILIKAKVEFLEAMDDDFNTPYALSSRIRPGEGHKPQNKRKNRIEESFEGHEAAAGGVRRDLRNQLFFGVGNVRRKRRRHDPRPDRATDRNKTEAPRKKGLGAGGSDT